MAKLTFNKKDLKRLSTKLKKLASEMHDFRVPLKKSARIIEDESKRNFDRQGFLYNMSWTPLSAGTRKQRASQGYPANRPILVRSGKLRDSVKTKSVSRDTATVVNPTSYAPYHQFGTGKIPKRTILSSSSKSRAAIGIVFGNYVGKIIKKVF